ncbi:MAG: hypothetical protein IK081_06955 [Lachnospiraceae bacterium]|nr:hypothetical protein [Lachnospiraceae bacterium]
MITMEKVHLDDYYQKVLDCCLAHESNPLLQGSTPEILLFEILRESIDAFVDEDQNRSHFDSEELLQHFMIFGEIVTGQTKTE